MTTTNFITFHDKQGKRDFGVKGRQADDPKIVGKFQYKDGLTSVPLGLLLLLLAISAYEQLYLGSFGLR